MDHNVVVDFGDEPVHINEFGENNNYDCQFLGQRYDIKKPAKKVSNDISKRLVDRIREKENIKKYEEQYQKKLIQRRREQENYSRQMPLGDGILNLEVADL